MRHAIAAETFGGFAGQRQIERGTVMNRGDMFEDGLLCAQVEEVGDRMRPVLRVPPGAVNVNKLVCVRVGERAYDDRAEHAEHRGVYADPQREGDERDGSEPGCSGERSKGVFHTQIKF